MNYDKTINMINNCICYIIKKGYSYNIKDIFPKNTKDNDLEYLLNYYLLHIKNSPYSLNLSIYKHFLNDNDKIVNNEINILFDDLLDKLFNKRKRNITLPVNIKYIKEYAISSMIDKKYLNDVIIGIIIRFAIINYINSICC